MKLNRKTKLSNKEVKEKELLPMLQLFLDGVCGSDKLNYFMTIHDDTKNSFKYVFTGKC